MTELYLMRHGQTDWNVIKRFQGVSDIPLNSTGHQQARQAAQEIAALDKKFTAIYSSPQQRAYQTALAVSEKLNIPVHLDGRLREINLGDWEGRLTTEVSQTDADLHQRWFENPFAVNPPGPHGEPSARVVERVVAALGEIAERHPRETVLISTHGFTMAAALCLAAGVALENVLEYLPGNADFIRVEWDSACCQSVNG